MPKTQQNGSGSIRKKGNTYEVRVTAAPDPATGERKRISRYAATHEEAVKLLHELSFLSDISPRLFQNVTLGEWLDMCLEVYMKTTLKQSTYNGYRTYIQAHFKPALGDILLSELQPRTLQMFYVHKMETENLSPKTIVNLNLFLHKALSFAVAEGYIRQNPAESLNLSRGQKPQIDVLTRDEQAALLRGSYGHRYGVFVRLTLFTGLRLGELLGLRWEDLDVRGGMIHVQRTLGRLQKMKQVPGEASTEIVLGTPKSQNSIRGIPVLPGIMNEVLSWRKVQEADQIAAGEAYVDSGFIVTNPLGGFVEPRIFRDYYTQILAMSGIKEHTFHSLRHTFATRAMEQGMDAKTLSILMGHYSVSFTMDTYTHVQDSHKIAEMERMNDLLTEFQTPQKCLYAVVVTPEVDGTVGLRVPDFPGIVVDGMDLYGGMELLKEKLQDEMLTSPIAPVMTPVEQISLLPGEMVMQLDVA